ncbi:sensor domain-containing protein [Nitratiruptor tergarcus]|uniref:PAS domain S-box-containing protein/diguanylate cyclase (GGDEF) domain-containing protein n=1 Tax=Nitratiruptor tergarcus DSM 16512 TaxID=1069081 RepID=A0A1W1WR97_9BACT|nr:EAL domain-containing protein [Nitratiruptor tergarcus]SMC08838.1 PAS domain S-box-containing protein/diguanylate cyclase (GGDEF) domain-containing protein [Nitratiruptor tergarcus DSM 16512]
MSSRLRDELAIRIFSVIPRNVAANFFAAIMTLYPLYPNLHFSHFVWLIAVMVVMLYRFILYFFFKKRKYNLHHLCILHYIGIVLTAGVWAGGIWTIFYDTDLLHKIYIAFVIAGLSAGAVVSFASDKKSGIIYTTSMLVPTIVWFFTASDRFGIAMGILAIVYYLFLLHASSQIFTTLLHSIRLSIEREKLLHQFKKSTKELQMVFESAPLGILFYDKNLYLLDANNTALEILGMQKKQTIGFDLYKLQNNSFEKILRDVLQFNEKVVYEGELQSVGDRKKLHMRLIANPVKDASGEVIGGLAIMEDIGKEVQTKEQLERFAQFYLKNPHPVMQIDCNKKTITIENESAKRLRANIIHWEHIVDEICTHKNSSIEEQVGSKYFRFDIVDLENGFVNVYVKDITAEKRAIEEAEFFAYYDELTKLPRKKVFTEFIYKAIKHAIRYDKNNALLFIDVDDFKKINDSYGHSIGDAFLVKIAQKIQSNLRGVDVVTRLGGDEFAILLTDLPHDKVQAQEKTSVVIRKIFQTLQEPLYIDGIKLQVTLSVGAVVFREGDIEELFKNADIAMYEAKREGKNRYVFYEDKIKLQFLQKSILLHELEEALAHNDLALYLQPIYDLQTRYCSHAEALVRWNYNRGNSILFPQDFLPLMEEGNMLSQLTFWVLKEVSQIASKIETLDYISVNMSLRDFERDDFIPLIKKLYESGEVIPQKIELELTGNAQIRNLNDFQKQLQALKDLGFRFAIDDFGICYSSLYYLKHFIIDTLKIDKNFIKEIDRKENDKILTKFIIDVAKLYNMHIVAEGVERTSQLKLLEEMGCEKVQGYLLARPMPVKDFEEFIKNYKRLPL